jgi:hypothetical protein
MRWLLAAAALPLIYFACRDLRLNFRSDPQDLWRGVAHSRARAASLAAAVVAPLLYPASDVLAIVFCVFSAALFWLVPNRWLTEPAKPQKSRRSRKSTWRKEA